MRKPRRNHSAAFKVVTVRRWIVITGKDGLPSTVSFSPRLDKTTNSQSPVRWLIQY